MSLVTRFTSCVIMVGRRAFKTNNPTRKFNRQFLKIVNPVCPQGGGVTDKLRPSCSAEAILHRHIAAGSSRNHIEDICYNMHVKRKNQKIVASVQVYGKFSDVQPVRLATEVFSETVVNYLDPVSEVTGFKHGKVKFVLRIIGIFLSAVSVLDGGSPALASSSSSQNADRKKRQAAKRPFRRSFTKP